MALLIQKAGNDEVSILAPRVILPQPPVFDVDVPSPDDAMINNNISNVSSDVLSAGTSTRGRKLISGKETTESGDVEGEYAHLPDDYLFNYTASNPKSCGGGENERDKGDNDDLDDPIDNLTDKKVSKYNFFQCLVHYLDNHCITNCNCKAVELAIFAEAGTHVRGLDPMKRATQEDVCMRKYLHIVKREVCSNTCDFRKSYSTARREKRYIHRHTHF